MQTPPNSYIEDYRSWLGAHDGFNYIFSVRGYELAEEWAAWLAKYPTLFDDIAEWLQDAMPERVQVLRSDCQAMMIVAMQGETDAVHFKLRWGDYL